MNLTAIAEQQTRERPANMPSKDALFCSYNVGHHPECQDAVNECDAFLCDLVASRGRWISLLGKSGVGKTMLSRIMRRFVRTSTNRKGMFIRWITACDYMRKGDFGVIDAMADADVLFCDDIGAAYETDLSKKKILEIAERRTQKPTVFTSNLDLEGIGREIDVRVASRMLRDGSRIAQFKECPDYALANYIK